MHSMSHRCFPSHESVAGEEPGDTSRRWKSGEAEQPFGTIYGVSGIDVLVSYEVVFDLRYGSCMEDDPKEPAFGS